MLSPPILITIVVLAFLYAGYHQWLTYRATQEPSVARQEFVSTLEQLNERLDQLEQERDELAKRLQNLETIVISEAWIVQHEDSVDPSSLPSEPADLELPSEPAEEPRTVAEKTADLARRLRDE